MDDRGVVTHMLREVAAGDAAAAERFIRAVEPKLYYYIPQAPAAAAR